MRTRGSIRVIRCDALGYHSPRRRESSSSLRDRKRRSVVGVGRKDGSRKLRTQRVISEHAVISFSCGRTHSFFEGWLFLGCIPVRPTLRASAQTKTQSLTRTGPGLCDALRTRGKGCPPNPLFPHTLIHLARLLISSHFPSPLSLSLPSIPLRRATGKPYHLQYHESLAHREKGARVHAHKTTADRHADGRTGLTEQACVRRAAESEPPSSSSSFSFSLFSSDFVILSNHDVDPSPPSIHQILFYVLFKPSPCIIHHAHQADPSPSIHTITDSTFFLLPPASEHTQQKFASPTFAEFRFSVFV